MTTLSTTASFCGVLEKGTSNTFSIFNTFFTTLKGSDIGNHAKKRSLRQDFHKGGALTYILIKMLELNLFTIHIPPYLKGQASDLAFLYLKKACPSTCLASGLLHSKILVVFCLDGVFHVLFRDILAKGDNGSPVFVAAHRLIHAIQRLQRFFYSCLAMRTHHSFNL